MSNKPPYISGFTFIRNGIQYDYPFIESIKSVLPLVDEMIVSIGNSDDETEAEILKINSPKIKIIHSIWDDTLREGGKVLAVETNKAKAACNANSNWLIYIQGDEIIPEKYYEEIKNKMTLYQNKKSVDGLLLKYKHFYGSYNYIADGINWYSKEIRIIKNNPEILSYKDAQGFRKNNKKLQVKEIDAYIYHYGWVRNPIQMLQKNIEFGSFWRNNEEQKNWIKNQNVENKDDKYDYNHIDSICIFENRHPSVMKERIENATWDVHLDSNVKKFKSLKHKIFYSLLKKFGWRPFEYKNYIKI